MFLTSSVLCSFLVRHSLMPTRHTLLDLSVTIFMLSWLFLATREQNGKGRTQVVTRSKSLLKLNVNTANDKWPNVLQCLEASTPVLSQFLSFPAAPPLPFTPFLTLPRPCPQSFSSAAEHDGPIRGRGGSLPWSCLDRYRLRHFLFHFFFSPTTSRLREEDKKKRPCIRQERAERERGRGSSSNGCARQAEVWGGQTSRKSGPAMKGRWKWSSRQNRWAGRSGESEGGGRGASGWDGIGPWCSGLFCFIIL